jgi:hypothetical protein
MADLTTPALNVTRVQTHAYKFTFTGLLPNTKHTVFYDGVDHTFATRTWGGDYGGELISDENGMLLVEMLIEIEFNRDQNFELPQGQSLSSQERTVNTQQRRLAKVVVQKRIIEAKSANDLSYGQIIVDQNLVLTPGTVRTLYPIE